MIKIKESKYNECIICGEKYEGIKEVCIYRNTGDNIICISLCPHCMRKMATGLTFAAIGEDPENLFIDKMPRKMVGHSERIVEQYYQE